MMKDPIKEVKNSKTGKITFEFAANLGIPAGETKPFCTRRRGFTSRKKAWEAYMFLKAQAKLGIYPDRKNKTPAIKQIATEDEVTANSTVKDYFTKVYWPAYLTKPNQSTTHDKTRNCFKNHILPAFSHVALKDLTPLKCKQFATMLTGKLKSSHRQILIYFKALLEDAKNMKLIEENPMEHVRIPSRNEILKSKKIPGEEDVFFSNHYNIEELMNFLTASKKYCSEMKHIFFLLLAHSGLRRGEAMALTWNDIDFEKRLIHVNKAAAYSTAKKLHIKETKNYMHRKVCIDSETMEYLQKWKASQERLLKMKNQYVKTDREQYIFQNRDNKLTDPAQAGRWLSQLYECSDIRQITVHGLRHTHCTLGLKSQQYSVVEMMHRLGHKDIKITVEIYAHVTAESMATNPDLYMEYLHEGYKKSAS